MEAFDKSKNDFAKKTSSLVSNNKIIGTKIEPIKSENQQKNSPSLENLQN